VRSHIIPSLAITSLVIAGCTTPAPPPAEETAAPAAAPAQDAVERGRYLVTVMDCNGCHTPFTPQGEPDMSKMLSGHPEAIKVTAARPPQSPWLASISETNTAWSGPWGVSFTSNLTPDRVSGIGSWNEQLFIDAIRQGKKSGVGRTLLPPMPWRMYANLTDDDLKAMFAYLQTIPAIANRVPEPIPAAGAPATN
jgi:mono/diheme cytochrome c family protein